MKTLLIFDIHQNQPWAEAILAKEEGNFDHLILGGDYFDTADRKLPNVQQTAAWLKDIPRRFGDRVILLMGNHDIQYIAFSLARTRRPRHYVPLYNCQSCFTNRCAMKVHKAVPTQFWLDHGRLFTRSHGYLISHAGVHPSLWPGSISALEAQCRIALLNCSHLHSPLLAPGIHRGGNQPVGGLTWADWEFDFADDEALPPQIVGHTADCGPAGKGRSWCLDGNQTCYGLLDEDGLLEVKVP